MNRDLANGARFAPGSTRGHYESWFCRANHPSRPLAFWIRYTIFAPKRAPGTLGELWAMFFDGENGVVTAVKREVPIDDCRFASRGLDVRIAEATLDADTLRGEASSGAHRIAWELRYTTPSPPLFLLDRRLYRAPLPKAKALVGSPHAAYFGALVVDGVEHDIDGWIGSQNHNWGSKHTDRYAWGQVAGFDDAPDAFLELATAQVSVGPWMTPPVTVLVLRLDGEELAFNTLGRAARASGEYEDFTWRFSTGDRRTRIEGTIDASPSAFVGLPYYDPPGGTKICLNTKLAQCALTVHRPGRPPRTLHTAHRAAFEILTDTPAPGIPLLDPAQPLDS